MMNSLKGKALRPDDDVLVARAKSGDDRAFQDLYLRHGRYVAAVVYRLLGHDHELDDIVQETFLAASRGINSVKEGKHIKLFLVTIAVRKTKRRINKQARRNAIDQRLQLEAEGEHRTGSDEQLKEAYDLLARLPKRLRIPWMLYKIEGYSLAEVSSICGASLATIKRRIKASDDRIKWRLVNG